MFCEQCGKQVSETAKFCSNCGAPVAREQMCEEVQIEHPIDSTLSSSANSEMPSLNNRVLKKRCLFTTRK